MSRVHVTASIVRLPLPSRRRPVLVVKQHAQHALPHPVTTASLSGAAALLRSWRPSSKPALAAPVPALFAVECTARSKKKRRSGQQRQPRQHKQKFVQVTRHSPPFSNKISDGAMVTATEAKKLYCLNEKDLFDLPCEERENPHPKAFSIYLGSSIGFMRLYERGDLKRAAIAKYGSEAGLAEKKRRNAEIAAKARATRAANKSAAAAAAATYE